MTNSGWGNELVLRRARNPTYSGQYAASTHYDWQVEHTDRLQSVMRNTPIKKDHSGWNCMARLKETLEGLEADGKALGTTLV